MKPIIRKSLSAFRQAGFEFVPGQQSAEGEEGGQCDYDGRHEDAVSDGCQGEHVDHQYADYPSVEHEDDLDGQTVVDCQYGFGDAGLEQFVAVRSVEVCEEPYEFSFPIVEGCLFCLLIFLFAVDVFLRFVFQQFLAEFSKVFLIEHLIGNDGDDDA
jgi:hypothetical protein